MHTLFSSQLSTYFAICKKDFYVYINAELIRPPWGGGGGGGDKEVLRFFFTESINHSVLKRCFGKCLESNGGLLWEGLNVLLLTMPERRRVVDNPSVSFLEALTLCVNKWLRYRFLGHWHTGWCCPLFMLCIIERYSDDLVQDSNISIADALEILQSCNLQSK